VWLPVAGGWRNGGTRNTGADNAERTVMGSKESGRRARLPLSIKDLKAATDLLPSAAEADPQRSSQKSTGQLPEFTAETSEERIYRLKLEGYSPRDIAFTVKVPLADIEATIIRMAERSRERLLAELSVGTILEVDRLDAMHKSLWPYAATGDGAAIDRVMSLSKERRKLLGLDAPAGIGNPSNEQDLSCLSNDELLELERIQRKLAEARRQKRLPAKRKGSESTIEVEAEVVPASKG
jgi:hypothetical protein